MTQILDLIGVHARDTQSTDDDPETPTALRRLGHMLSTVGTLEGKAPSAGSVPACKPEPDDDGGGQADDLDVPSLVEVDANGVADTCTADEGDEGPTEPLASAQAVEEAVRAAQQRAEIQLTALVERVEQAEAENHAVAVARVNEAAEQRLEHAVREARADAEAEARRERDELERRHAEELDEVRRTTQAEVAAAVSTALSDQNHIHAAELARMQDDLERRHADSLRRVETAVLASFEALIERMAHAA